MITQTIMLIISIIIVIGILYFCIKKLILINTDNTYYFGISVILVVCILLCYFNYPLVNYCIAIFLSYGLYLLVSIIEKNKNIK